MIHSLASYYLQSKLYSILDAGLLEGFKGIYIGMRLALHELLHGLWTELIPQTFQPLFSDFSDAMIQAYCLGGAKFLEALSSNSTDSVVASLQKALLYCLCIKTCMKMRGIHRWKSSTFEENLRDADIKVQDNIKDSDVAELEAEDIQGAEEGAEESEAVKDRGAAVRNAAKSGLTFANKLDEAKGISAEERWARANEEIERRRHKKVAEMRAIGAKFHYLNGFVDNFQHAAENVEA
jgi:hypothetical protein